MKRPTKQVMTATLDELRTLGGSAALTYGQSLQAAHDQAAYLRAWSKTRGPEINLIWLVQQRAVPVNFVPGYKLGGHSGLTTDHITGRLEISINDSEPRVRQRFSLLHELKHVIDWDQADLLHSKLGSGDDVKRRTQIEQIANEFAASVLMPAKHVIRLWQSSPDLSLMASLFNVSAEAMHTRLEKLGLIFEPKPAPRLYFRSAGLVTGDTECMLALAS